MRVSRIFRDFALVAALIVGGPALGLNLGAQAASEHFTAFAVNIAPMTRTVATTVDISVDRWSTDAESNQLFGAMSEGGPNRLLDVVQKLPTVGHIRTPDSIGYDLHYAQRTTGSDGSERIVIVTDRPIGFWEAVNRPRVSDYPFTVIEMRVPPDGKGEGKISVAAKLAFDPDTRTLTLEDWAAQPVMLSEVKREKK